MFYTLLLVLDLVSALAPFESCDPVSVSPVGHATVRKNRGETSQGGALLCPGLSHFAPLGRGDRWIIVEVQWIDRSDRERSRRVSDESVNPAVAPLPLDF